MDTRFQRFLTRVTLLALFLGLAVGALASTATAAPPSFTDQVVALTNQARAENGLPPLKVNPQLAAAAQKHAEAMAAGKFMDHKNPTTGTTPGDRVLAEGYKWSAVGENVAGGAPTPAEVVANWLKSPAHRANILNPDFREIGVGYFFKKDDTFPGPTGYGHYWVQVFGARPDDAGAAGGSPAPATPARTWRVLCPSSVDKRGHPTWDGKQVILKGVVRGAPGISLDYQWSPGDRSAPIRGTVNDPFSIADLYTYPAARPGTTYAATLVVTDTVTGLTDSCVYPVVVYEASQDPQVEAAIDDGLWFLHTQMIRSSKDGVDYGYWEGDRWDVGITAKGLLAFEMQNHQADGDADRDPYVETVQRGLNYLFAQMQQQPLDVQPAGDPDSNGNGFGLYLFSDSSDAMYEDSIAAMAVVASATDSTLQTQVGGDGVVGRTYAEIAQDLMDFLVWTQVDAPNDFYRGGWRYVPRSSDADMSVTQWPVLALEAAETNWGLTVPAWAKTELRDYFLKNIQDETGGFGYATRGDNNVARTAAGMICLRWVGVPADDSRVTAAQAYITAHWDESNLSNFYAMYGVMKGSRLTDPPITLYGSHDWYSEYATYLVQHQAADGHWNDVGIASGNLPLSTAWGVLILSRGVVSYVAPQPGSVEIDCPPATLALTPGQAVAVTSQLKGVSLPTCQGIPGKPVDLFFVFDTSKSAGSGPGSNWEQTIAYTERLLDSLSTPILRQREVTETSRLGLITTVVTGTAAQLTQPLTQDYTLAKTKLENIRTGGTANISNSLRLTQKTLAKEPADRARAIVLMLHNIKALDANTTKAVKEISPTIPIYLVNNTVNVKPAEQITDAKARQLLPESHIFHDPTPDDLRRLFVLATGGDITAAARWLHLADTWSPPGVLEFSKITGPGGRIEGDGIIWDAASLAVDEVAPLGYKIKAPAAMAGSTFTLTREIAYVDCNGYPQKRQVCRKAFEANLPPTPIPEIATTTSAPPTITLTLCPEELSPPQNLVVNLPPAPVKADVLFVFDVTGSMEPVLTSAAQNADRIMGDLAGLIKDVQFGVVSLADYPLEPYGAAGDLPYALERAITSDQAQVRAALNALTLSNGEDDPESYSRAFYELYSDPAIGWRPGARHLIVSFGDSVAHDDDLNAGVAAPQPYRPGQAFVTGYAPTKLDPGRDGAPDTADDLDWQTVLTDLRTHEITVLHVVSGSAGKVILPANTLLAYWKYWAGLTGGDAVLQENADQLPDTIRTLVAQAGRRINALRLEADPGYSNWLQSNPPQYQNLLVPDTGLDQAFQAVFTVPRPVDRKVVAGEYRFTVRAVGDGTAYAAWNVVITIPKTCPDIEVPIPVVRQCEKLPWSVTPWLLPLLLLLLMLLLWWLGQRMIWGKDWLAEKLKRGVRCWLPCLLALLLLLLLVFLFARRLSGWICLNLDQRPAETPAGITFTPAPTPTPRPGQQSPVAPSGPLGSTGSRQVALVGPMPDPGLPGVNFTPLSVDELTLANLLNYDTLVLAQVCNIGELPPNVHQDIVNWVAGGRKLIIYDSDECYQPVNYTWLLYPFTTDNPGAQGSSNGVFTIVADDTLVNSDPRSPYFVDAAELSHTEIGDANVMVTQDPRWCGDAMARNLHGQEGFVHTYAFYGNGLLIYNGLDTDSIGYPSMSKLWQNELTQTWDGLTGKRPASLTCQRHVAGSPLFGPIVIFGIPIPFWLPWLLLPLLWLLCYLGCRKRELIEAKGGGIVVPPPTERKYVPPPEPLGGWAGPPPVWDPEKTLIIGLGGAGRWVLTLIKKNLQDAGAGTVSPRVRLLLLDNAPEERIGQEETDVSFAGVRLSKEEILPLGQDFNDLIRAMATDATREPEIATWFPAKYYAERKEAELDLRKGTGGQRPLGRLVAFNDLRQTDASRLWAALLDGMAVAQEGEQARVMIVGSLAGGFGSATVADVAYLAQHAARKVGARFASIEAYLATQHTFDSVSSLASQREQAANAFAALRELRRLQLIGHSFPYRITYNEQRRGDPVWAGQIDHPLLDDLYLFDAYRPQVPLLREKPVNGVFATMADAITLHLDRASRLGEKSLWAHRRLVQGQATTEQQVTGQAVVSSLGTFAYRLPVYDLVEALKARWAKHFLGLLILGEAGGQLRLDPNLNREEPAGSVATRARQFVQGMAGLGTPPAAVLLLSQTLDRDQLSTADWATQASSLHVSDAEGEVRRYRVHLVDALSKLLNGFSEDPLVARTGKLGYALRWLELVERDWSDVAQEMQMLPSRLGGKVPKEIGTWQKLPELYRAATAAVRAHFAATCASVSRDLGAPEQSGWRGAGQAPQAVYDRLVAREEKLVAYRKEMAAIVTRHYFMDDKLIESWYKRYLAEQVSPNIWRLHWQPTADGNGVELVLNGVGGRTRLHGDGPEALAKALLDLGGYLAQAIWSQETLATYLAGTILQPDKIPGTAKEMWAVSSPLLDYDTGAAPNVQAVAVLGANPTVRDTEPLLREFIPRLPNERQMRTLEITDPYAMLLARMIDVIPSDATTPHRDAEKVYRPTYGLSAETAGRGTYAPPRAVFPAERHALAYEQRLPEINQAPRLFHPMFVTALEDEKRAILFVKALAGGLMRAEYRDDTEVVVVDTPTGPYPLSAPEDRQYRRVSPVVLSMLRFVIAPERTLRGVEEMLQGIPDLEQRWRDFVKHELPEMSKSELGGEKDLAAFADLVLYDLLEGRTS